jgi:cytochrome d ubiquinol oxidase subunit II
MFSSLYTPLMFILFALILRGAALELRGKTESKTSRAIWDICFVAGSFLPALLFGVAFANIFRGVPIDGEGVLQGNLLTLLNPYGLLGGLLFLFLFLFHGSIWLATKSEGNVHQRAAAIARRLWPVVLIVAVLFLVFTAFQTKLYENYMASPVLFIIPLLCVCALLATRFFIMKQSYWKAWFASCATIATATLFGVIGLFPSLFPSSLSPAYSMTIHNSASSQLTLKIMLVVALIFVPIVIVYQSWVFNLFKAKVTDTGGEDEAY